MDLHRERIQESFSTDRRRKGGSGHQQWRIQENICIDGASRHDHLIDEKDQGVALHRQRIQEIFYTDRRRKGMSTTSSPGSNELENGRKSDELENGRKSNEPKERSKPGRTKERSEIRRTKRKVGNRLNSKTFGNRTNSRTIGNRTNSRTFGNRTNSRTFEN